MSEQAPEFDPSPDDGRGPEARPQNVSKPMLWVAMAIMLIPAGIPLYFAIGAEGSAVIWLFALAGTVAIVNISLVYGLWRWVNTLSAESE